MPKLSSLRSGAVAAAVLAVLALAAAPAIAQDYPNRPITLIVPFPPGGSTTIVGRIVADKMSEVLGQSIVVDNRGGAGGTIGSRAVAKSAPDGYTILLGYTGTLAIGPSLYGNVGYDPRTDFEPIGRIGTAPNTLVVHPSFPVHSVPELIAYAKANPGKVNFGSAGIGTVSHVCGEYFANVAGVKITHVPYKGSGPALNDLLGGHVTMMFSTMASAAGLVREGSKVRALAVTGATRSELFPNLPTVAEAGLPGYEAVLHYGIVAPAGTPRPVIEKLNAALNAALGSGEVKRRLAVEGAEALPVSPDEYAADIAKEEAKWSEIIRKSGMKAD